MYADKLVTIFGREFPQKNFQLRDFFIYKVTTKACIKYSDVITIRLIEVTVGVRVCARLETFASRPVLR